MNTAHTNTLPEPGQRIECIEMLDDFAVPAGSRGTVLKVVQYGTYHHIEVAWDNNSTLYLLSNADQWKVLSRE